MTHTPGPWTVIKLPDQKDAFDWAVQRDGNVLTDDLGGKVTVSRFQSERDAQAHADNLTRLERKAVQDRLIAAAPDTLQMLKNMVEGIVAAREAAHWSAEQKQAWLNGLVDAARAAIAKAEGKS